MFIHKGVESFVWISSVGANAKSKNFYLRVKGELENAIINMSGLENPSAVRPSLLLGDRDETRLAELLGSFFGKLISPLLRGKLSKYKPSQKWNFMCLQNARSLRHVQTNQRLNALHKYRRITFIPTYFEDL